MIGVPEKEEREQEIESLLNEIMAENFPNLMKEKDTQVQETERVPNKRSLKRCTARHITTKMPKVKDREL